MNLTIKHTTDENESILSLSGEIDAHTAPELKEALGQLTKQSGQEIIVDLENVSYMDSTGLGLFIGALKSAKENDGELKLINIQERVFRLFQITGLDEVMDLKSVVREGEE